MPDMKKIFELTIAVVLGMVLAYIIVWLLQKAGLVNVELDDTWGILLGIVGIVLTVNSMRNSQTNIRIEKKFDILFSELSDNKKKDEERDVVINDIKTRVNSLEEWRSQIDGWRKEAKGFEARLKNEIKEDIKELKDFFLKLYKIDK